MNGYQRSREIRRSELCAPGRPDTVGHSSIQAWSAGELFPAVIARIEMYPAESFPSLLPGATLTDWTPEFTCWELTLDGVTAPFVSYDAAAQHARRMLADPELRRDFQNWRSAGARVPDAMGVI